MTDETKAYLTGAEVGLGVLFGITGVVLWRFPELRPERPATVWWLLLIAAIILALLVSWRAS